MRALIAAIVCSAVFAGTLYLGGQSVGAFDGPAGATSGAAAKKRANKATFRFNARDQRAARAATLTRADLGRAWRGGKKELDFSADAGCANYQPRAWDLVVTGAMSAEYTHPRGRLIGSHVRVLQTPRMVRLDWKRSFQHPNLMSCLRRVVDRALAREGGALVSLRRRPFPRMATHVARFRIVASVRDAVGRRVPFFADIVVLGQRRHEITLLVGGRLDYRGPATRAEVRLAKRLLRRVRS